MLRVIFSNSIEALTDNLTASLQAPPENVLAPEQIIVPSAAVKRHVQHRYAQTFGVCANVHFSFLARWIWGVIHQTLGSASEQGGDADTQAWRIFELLSTDASLRHLPRLAAYLDAADEPMRYEFAVQMAGLFEHYANYRADWLAQWAQGTALSGSSAGAADGFRQDEAWQRALWRALWTRQAADDGHPVLRFLQFLRDGGRVAGLPPVIHLFAIPALPPLHLEILALVAGQADIRLYLLTPCREYWFEIIPAKLLSHLRREGRDHYHETGHALLANWGRQTQAMVDLLYQQAGDSFVAEENAGFEEPGHATLLAALQQSLLDLQPPPAGAWQMEDADDSIEVHVCHSLTRELEVIHNRLLALFGANPSLKASDVLIVLPDLAQAAPSIDAVFGAMPAERHIPYSITGRPLRAENPFARNLLELLALLRSRFGVNRVFDLAQSAEVARKFGLEAADLDLIRRLVAASGMRWGIDSQHLETILGHPLDDRHSLEGGFSRLFLGFAMPTASSHTCNGVLPCDDLEGSQTLVLGRFWRFWRGLLEWRQRLAEPRTGVEWCDQIRALLNDFFAAGAEDLAALAEVEQSIERLREQLAASGVCSPIPFSVMETALGQVLEISPHGGVPSGRVTFTTLTALRGLAYRVIVVAGFNDGAFPTAGSPLEFDLMAASPRKGDRQRRLDERNIFLDLLISAREKLWFSYSGRSIRDNAPVPPSILLAELLDFLVRSLADPAGGRDAEQTALRRLVIEHPLQAFSARYFMPEPPASRLFSFDAGYLAALRQRQETLRALPPTGKIACADAAAAQDDDNDGEGETAVEFCTAFIGGRLDPPGEEWRTLDLDRLLRFFRNPCRFLLQERLGIELAVAREELAEDEPFALDYQGRRGLAERLLPPLLAGRSAEDLYAVAAAGPELPGGTLGEILLRSELAGIADFAQALKIRLDSPLLPPLQRTLDWNIEGERWTLQLSLNNLRPEGLCHYRYDETRTSDYLSAWLYHLSLCAAEPAEAARQTRWISNNGMFLLGETRDAIEILGELMALYTRGLRKPLHFFPNSAWEFIKTGHNLAKARAKWVSAHQRSFAESQDRYYQLALRGVEDSLDAEFVAAATQVFGVMTDYLEDDRL